MNNLEIKVQVGEINNLKSRLSFAEHKGILEQKDTYYLVGKTRLKIREEKNNSEIILYSREYKDGTRKSVYHRTYLSRTSTKFLKTILQSVLGTKVIVEKQRDLYLYQNTRIHLDTVSNLSDFMELETVISNKGKYKQYLDEHEEVKIKLALAGYPAISGSYSDLMISKK